MDKWNFVRRDDGVEASYPALDRVAEYKHREYVDQWLSLVRLCAFDVGSDEKIDVHFA